MAGLIAAPIALPLFVLIGLTILSGCATLRLPTIPASFSISDSFTITAALLYGPEAGTVAVAIDSLVISYQLARRNFGVAAAAVQRRRAGAGDVGGGAQLLLARRRRPADSSGAVARPAVRAADRLRGRLLRPEHRVDRRRHRLRAAHAAAGDLAPALPAALADALWRRGRRGAADRADVRARRRPGGARRWSRRSRSSSTRPSGTRSAASRISTRTSDRSTGCTCRRSRRWRTRSTRRTRSRTGTSGASSTRRCGWRGRSASRTTSSCARSRRRRCCTTWASSRCRSTSSTSPAS